MKSQKATTNSDLADWCSALASAVGRQPEKVPPGWKTASALAAEQNLSLTAIKLRLSALLQRNQCERRKFLVEHNGGNARLIYHYRLLKK